MTEEQAKTFSCLIRSALDELKVLKDGAHDQVNISTLDFPIAFGIDAIDIEEAHGIIYLRYYPLAADDDMPIVVLRPHESLWFGFYKKQLQIHASLSKPWPPEAKS